jgi:hypothetical protein
MSRSSWEPILDRNTPFSALDGLIESFANEALADLRRLIDSEGLLTPQGLDVAIERARPRLEAQTRQAIVNGWTACQLDGAPTH